MSIISNRYSNWSILKGANKAIVVCGDLSCDEREKHTLMACSAATQNILLKATELEVGSVWLGIYPDESRVSWIKDILNMPESIVPIALVVLGYTDDAKERSRELDRSKIHFNRW